MAAPPFKVKAVYEYTSGHEDDLNFPLGQVITVTELEGDDWYVGEYTDVTGAKHEGLFPTNFVEKYEPEVPSRPVRPTRVKQEAQQPAAQPEPREQPAAEPTPVPSTSSKPANPAVDVPPAGRTEPEVTSPRSATSQKPPADVQTEKAPAPKPAPVDTSEAAAPSTKKAPPPVAAKSNAFKDRIAAFNQPAAAPVAPMQPGGKAPPPSGFIKKPFVAPPPSKNAYVPPPKADTVHKPYNRDEDPEIRQRQEDDRAAAEAAGLTAESTPAPASNAEEEDEDAPKPLTLKERMALLQKQQQEQAQRRAETTHKKEKKPPQKQLSESSERAAGDDEETAELERVRTDATERQPVDVSQDRRRVPSAQRRPPEPMSPLPAPPDHEILSDGHEADQSGAGELTEDDTGTLGPDDSDERPGESARNLGAPRAEADVGDEQDTTEDEEAEEEEEVDEETRRKEELRARMARLGGGMPGMGAPFNPFGAQPSAASRKKPSVPKDRQASGEAPPEAPQQRVPMIPVPGMQRMQSPGSDTSGRIAAREGQNEEDEDEQEPPPPPSRSSTLERAAPPPVPKDSRPMPRAPQERAVPPPPPRTEPTARVPSSESRPVPPPPPPAAAPLSPGPGSESDDELSSHAAETPGMDTPLPIRGAAPPVPISRDVPPRPPQSPDVRRSSQYAGTEPLSPASDKRSSRVAPPIPAGSPAASSRPPPPAPPTMDVDEDEQVGSEYDGDYDTDIASSAKHRDALKAPHNRESSLTDNSTFADESSLNSPTNAPPSSQAPRAVPPPPPEAAVPVTRTSMDRPPPPVPSSQNDNDPENDYDPYRYPNSSRSVPPVPNATPSSAPPVPPLQQAEESSEDEMYAPPSPSRRSTDRAPPPIPPERSLPHPHPSQDRAVPPPPSQAPPSSQPPSRASTDLLRSQTVARRSTEQGRPSGEHGQIASEMNLPTDTPWWAAAQPLPPSLQSRNGVDVLSECEEASKSKRGGRKEITKDIYILYMDYSQTVISVRYDSQDPADVHFEQRHEPPPQRLRQDQLEAAWQRFGTKLADAAAQVGHSKKDSVVGDGASQSLPFELIKAHQDALLPVGTRAYGALVYANLANASTMQYDEIRRGDIITVRNAKFEGHHGAMKSKYKSDYGSSHVAVVEEWDGTRRAVRAWEQGREKKGGVRSEKFRLGDLRSGEVRVWRVVGRDWVGWES